MFFEDHDGATPIDTPLCGAERVRKLNEPERSAKKYGGAGRSRSGSGAGRSQSGSGAVSGGYRKRREQ